MKHLYLHIYFSFIRIFILFGILTGLLWFITHDDDNHQKWLAGMATILSRALPGSERPVSELRLILTQLHEQLDLDVEVRNPQNELIASVGKSLKTNPPPMTGTWYRHQGWIVSLALSDGRKFIARHYPPRQLRWLWAFFILAFAIIIGSYPLVRRLTRRLERLQTSVEKLGAGDLTSRITVEGCDEVASLARSFNQAADRIEKLVEAQRSMLATASHELRTPLTRIRMAIELYERDSRQDLRERIARDINELDELIEELLLMSRLQSVNECEVKEPVELLTLITEEGSQVSANISGDPISIPGNTRMLRRMLRNLFENAQIHGQGSRIDAYLISDSHGLVEIIIEDHGPGIPEKEVEHIFEPFYRASTSISKGTGLGLTLVRKIAQCHGGNVVYLPGVGGGSRFVASFPPLA